MINMVKLPTNKSSLFLRVAKGHFATSHSHINYYIDVTTQKARLSEAKAVAKELVAAYQHSTIVDTVLCLDGTQVIGTCLANELTKDGFANMNAHQTIYVITPEFNSTGQMIFRDNYEPMINGKNILILNGSITTGSTLNRAIESVLYYGGKIRGVAAIYSSVDSVATLPVHSIFQARDIPDYRSYRSDNCPLCKKRQKIDAIVSSYGYSVL
jgi:orotate phosphoribosyltransferase